MSAESIMKTAEIFVFGSNERGVHGAGAALAARMKFGAEPGVGFGFTGQTFAIPTKDWEIQSLPLESVKFYVDRFIAAAKCTDNVYKVTRIGCGLAGFKDAYIAPLFAEAPENCTFDTEWQKYLPEGKKYWGTF